MPPPRARTSLRQALYRLGKALAAVEPKALNLKDDTVALDPGSVEVDVFEFQRLVTEGTPSALETAMELYRGEFLEGVDPEAPAFEEWLLAERDRLREQAVEGLAKLLAHQRSAGSVEAALQTGLRLLSFEPAQESVHRAVIRLLLRLKRRGAAHRQFKLCVETLKDELGIVPEAETQQLYQEILGAVPEEDPSREGDPTFLDARPRASSGRSDNWLTGGELARLPFCGRRNELLRLERRLKGVRAGSGGLCFLVGEPGIGKTRILEEFAERARATGVRVLHGRCLEGELARPFGPFAEAIASYAAESDADTLREEFVAFGAVVAKIAPELRERLPSLPEPAVLAPEEERHRLLDAVAHLLWTIAGDGTLVVILDDLHWADGATLTLLRYLAPFLPRHRVLVLGGYRNVELDRRHPLGDTLGALYSGVGVERIVLSGLPREAVTELLEAVAKREVAPNFVEAITVETGGNPFFLHEVLLHLLEEGKLVDNLGSLTSCFSLAELGIPEGVRQVVRRRLSRLSEAANRLLATASACAGAFRFDVTSAVAELEEGSALDGLDEALEAHLLYAPGPSEVYDFTHALIRHTLYSDLSPSRRARLHRQLAEEMEHRYASELAEHALEVAQQWHRSASLPGAERGVVSCLLAADRAEEAAAHEDEAAALRMALDLLPSADARRPRLLARLGLALAWSRKNDDAVRVASEAGELLEANQGSGTAADYLAEATAAVWASNFDARAWALAEQGLRYTGSRRDLTWARLVSLDLDRRDANDPDFPGIRLDRPGRREATRVLLTDAAAWLKRGTALTAVGLVFESREDAIERAGSIPQIRAYVAGEYAEASALARECAIQSEAQGRLGPYVLQLTVLARCQSALGNLTASREAYARASEFASRIGNPPFIRIFLQSVSADYVGVEGTGHALLRTQVQNLLAQATIPENRWVGAAIRAGAALTYAYAGQGGDALGTVERVLPAVERAAGWAWAYTVMVFWLIETLWVLNRSDHSEVLERNLRKKTLVPDFRHPHTDGRLALARLCALTGRFDEAKEWFDRARRVLEEQGARPLRAITDFDEAWMELRRGEEGNPERALALLKAAHESFEQVGMPGWRRRADGLRQQLKTLS
jgi:DNA-binding SARP family transcriptional activator/tetratricopeptide (TPR) repeat protein